MAAQRADGTRPGDPSAPVGVGRERAIAYQPYLLRSTLAERGSALLDQLLDLGYDSVEPFDLSAQPVFADPRADGRPVPLAATAHDRLVGRDVEPIIRAAHRSGLTTIIEPIVDPQRWHHERDIHDLAAEFTALAQRYRDEGISIGYHNHTFEITGRIRGTTALEIFADAVAGEVELQLDVWWAEVADASAVDLLHRLGPAVTSLHLKDGIHGPDPHQTPIGRGALPLADILAAAPQASLVVAPDTLTAATFDDAATSLQTVRDTLRSGR